MNTPIYNFAKKYAESNSLRLHMPGHKGKPFLGLESFDITEFDGADDLFSPSGIIKESEENASCLFGANTFYSTEGSSLSIRAMLFLCQKYAKEKGVKPLILAGRNAHKSFLSACALLDLEVEWIFGSNSYLSCDVDKQTLKNILSTKKDLPIAVYITTPDYLGNLVNVKGLSDVCKEFGILLIVDNAHGAYLKFLKESKHPIDLGADMCSDSAHKTLPALTGASYLHISKNAPRFFKDNVKKAMALFASTSPSYVILQSLDLLNAYLYNGYNENLAKLILHIDSLKSSLNSHGYSLVGLEPLKICINVKPFGYDGFEFNDLLKKHGVFCEFYDSDYVVFMITTENNKNDLLKLKNILLSIPKRDCDKPCAPASVRPKKAMNIRDAITAPSEIIPVCHANGRVLSTVSVSCPPAVPIIASGEIIDEKIIELFNYYNIKEIEVVK